MSTVHRTQVLNLYKNLLYMGKEYPQGYDYFRTRCNAVFRKNKDITDPAKVEGLLAQGEFVIKELKALYYLKKYRTLKRRYYADEIDMTKFSVLKSYTSDKNEN